jgi:hypothetical protein
MICVVVLQNCMGFVEGETESCSDTCVTCDDHGTEEGSIKIEEAIHIKAKIPEPISFPSLKTEQEVKLCGVCDVVAAHASMSFVAPKRKL